MFGMLAGILFGLAVISWGIAIVISAIKTK